MAIVHDNQTDATNGFASSLTFAHTTSGSDKILIVATSHRTASATVTSITHNGNALTQIRNESAGSIAGEMWYLINPATTGNVVVTFSVASQVTAIANSYTGVHQTTPLGTDAGASGTAASSSLNLSSATNEMCVDAVTNRNNQTHTITGGQTLRGNQTTAATSASASEESGAASVDMSWSWASISYSHIAVPLKPAGAGPSVTIPVIMNHLRNQGIS